MQREIKASGINHVSQLEWSDHIPPPGWACGHKRFRLDVALMRMNSAVLMFLARR
jgi:hypothetical protein